jgi:hypothetical protein
MANRESEIIDSGLTCPPKNMATWSLRMLAYLERRLLNEGPK